MEFAGRPLRHLADLFRIAPAGPRPSTLRDHVLECVRRHADRPAFRQAGGLTTYAEWNQRANRYARWARSRDLREGDVVALLVDNAPEALAACVGLAKVGVATALLDQQDTIGNAINLIGARRTQCLIIDSTLLRPCLARRDLVDIAQPVFIMGEPDCSGAARFGRFDLVLGGFSGSEIPHAERAPLTGHECCLLHLERLADGSHRLRSHDHIGLLRAIGDTASAVGLRRRDRLYLATQPCHSLESLIAAAAILSRGGVCVIGDRGLSRNVWSDARDADCTLFAASARLLEPLSFEQIRASRGLVAGLTPEPKKRSRFRWRSSSLVGFPPSCLGEITGSSDCGRPVGASRADRDRVFG